MDNPALETAMTIRGEVTSSSPFGIIRQILNESRSLGSNSFSYYISPAVHTTSGAIERTHFTDNKAFSRATRDRLTMATIKLHHDHVITNGVPQTYLELFHRFRDRAPEIADSIRARINAQGIVDQYIFPVYGPFKIEGCMCFSFDREVDKIDACVLPALQTMAVLGHYKIVASFHDRMVNVQLSKRETQILYWMGMGKTNKEIALIYDLQPSTVNTYTRRIFDKFQVHSKVGAVLAAIAHNVIKL